MTDKEKNKRIIEEAFRGDALRNRLKPQSSNEQQDNDQTRSEQSDNSNQGKKK